MTNIAIACEAMRCTGMALASIPRRRTLRDLKSITAAAVTAFLLSCHAMPQPQVDALSEPTAATQVGHALPAQQFPEPDALGRRQLRLSPTNLVLPAAPPDAPGVIVQFYAAATRAIRHTYEDDVDDPSLLEALTARLQSEPALQSVRAIWLPALHTAQRRAATLRLLGPTLRALRQALANAWRDELTRTYRDIDMQACRAALMQMPAEPGDRDTPLQDTVVTIEPLGTYPLLTFQRFCEDSRSLYGRELP